MKENIATLLCRVIGHVPNSHYDAVHGTIWCCERCRRSNVKGGLLARLLWITKMHFRTWLEPCSDCGRRFHRHDDSVDHVPF